MQLDKSKTVQNLKGIFKRQTRMRRPLDFKKLRRAFEVAMAKNALKEMRGETSRYKCYLSLNGY